VAHAASRGDNIALAGAVARDRRRSGARSPPCLSRTVSSVQPLMSPSASSEPSERVPLKERFLRAGGWAVFAFGGTMVLRLASSLIMTRLLAPEAFGLVAIVTAVATMATLLSDIGLRQAVVHSQHGDDARMLDTAWTMQVLRGGLIWGTCCLVGLGLYLAGRAGWLEGGSVYASPLLPLLMTLGTFQTVIIGFETTKRFTADRRIEQKRVVLIELGSMLIGLLVMMTLGALTRSVWAIVVGSLVTSTCSVLAGHRWLHGHANRFAWDRAFAREIFDYGKWILASSLLFVLTMQSDKLLLGVWVTPAVLGCYAIGQNLAQILELAVGRVFSQVTAPAFGDVVRNSPHRLREVYLRLRLPFDLIFVAGAGFTYALGPWLVGLMYDSRYAEAGTILQILSFALLFARNGVSISAFLALQAPHAQAVMNLVRVIAFFVAVPLSYGVFGVQGAYWAIALHASATLPVVWWYNHRYGILSWRHELLTLAVWPAGWAAGWAFTTAMHALGR
jgi:O-antigen/teichoic acid export membrane protein